MEIMTYNLANKNGMSMKVTNLGCAIMTLNVPGKDGKTRDIAQGLASAEDYLKEHPSFGVVVGRYANRINRGKFTLGGKEYTLECNNGPNHPYFPSPIITKDKPREFYTEYVFEW